MSTRIISTLCVLALTLGCYNLTGENHDKAVQEAQTYATQATKAGADVKFVACMDHDTDGDGYQSDELPEGQLPSEAVIAEGVIGKFGFHPARVEDARAFVTKALGELSDDFREGVGGGASFLSMCQDRHGDQWTGEHRAVEQLCVLAITLGLATWTVPRGMWSALPGGMPYFTIKQAA